MKKRLNVSETFGSYIRRLRIKNNIGQRELAKKIGVAPSYLNDIEKNKRTAPRIDLIKKLSVILKLVRAVLFHFFASPGNIIRFLLRWLWIYKQT